MTTAAGEYVHFPAIVLVRCHPSCPNDCRIFTRARRVWHIAQRPTMALNPTSEEDGDRPDTLDDLHEWRDDCMLTFCTNDLCHAARSHLVTDSISPPLASSALMKGNWPQITSIHAGQRICPTCILRLKRFLEDLSGQLELLESHLDSGGKVVQEQTEKGKDST